MSGSGSDAGGTDKSKGQRPGVVSKPKPEPVKPLDANRELNTGGKLLARTGDQDGIAANYQWPAGRGNSPAPGASPPINQPDKEEAMAAVPARRKEPTEETQIPKEGGIGQEKDGESGEEVGKKEDNDQNATGSIKTGKAASKQLPSPQSVVLELAKTCQKEHKGSGSFELILRFSNFKIVELRTKGQKELAKTLSCLREKLRAVGSKPEKESWSFSLKL